MTKLQHDIKFDKEHLWHPYTSMENPLPCFKVNSAQGCTLKLTDDRELIDGMSSWWCVIHGYNHPEINNALKKQIDKVSHVMFGGLTHDPAIQAGEKILSLLPDKLNRLFFADSGSVSVEVALKMALQYFQNSTEKSKTKFLTVRGGYHGDTTGAMAVTDPDNGMHSLFTGILPEHFFAPRPTTSFHGQFHNSDISELEEILKNNNSKIAAVILEPIVQGAGGMWFYSPDYLNRLRTLCTRYNVLLIFDEIATGFGRTGKLFAFEHTEIIPDIICIGKSLTGGYMTLGAVITSNHIARQIDTLMHGPTFMANPLATAAAAASIDILLKSDWQQKVKNIEKILKQELLPAKENQLVNEIRVLGAIGVVELKYPVRIKEIQKFYVDNGVWIRPFGKLVYIMPPFIISPTQLKKLCSVLIKSLQPKYIYS